MTKTFLKYFKKGFHITIKCNMKIDNYVNVTL